MATRGWVGDTGGPNSETWLADEQPSEQGHAGEGREQQLGMRLLLCCFPSSLQTNTQAKLEPDLEDYNSALTALTMLFKKR